MKRLSVLMLLMTMLLCLPALAEQGFEARQESQVVGFSENTITVTAPENGQVTLQIVYGNRVYRIMENLPVSAGENTVTWNGLAANGERLIDGAYTLEATFTGASGATYQAKSNLTAKKCKQALLFALPSCDTLYLKDEDSWFIEYQMVRAGKMVVEYYRADDLTEILQTKTRSVPDEEVHKYAWDGKIGGKTAAEGDYVLRLYAKDNPDYVYEVRVTVHGGKSPSLPLTVTGPVVPERGMSDEEIWEIMMKPSVVTNRSQTGHQKVYAEMRTNSESLGTLHGRSQAVEVLAVYDGWARVGGWNHETGSYMEGYVPTDRLMTALPDEEYGLLIDKQDQTLTLFHEGRRVGTVSISTGKVTKTRMIRETAAGAFLTVDRIAEFSDSGYKYDFAIRYDGGNLLHQMGYKVVDGHRNFDDQVPQLGQKASHACIRLPVTPEEGGITAYWLYTHLPYHTRVIILDDKEQRTQQAEDVGVKVTDVYAAWPEEESQPAREPLPTLPALAEGETELTITAGGDAVLGTREKWQNRADAFPAYVEANGMAYPFSGLYEVFSQDDMTFVNLEGVLKETSRGEQTSKLYRFRGDPSYTGILTAGSIEQVNIANNHHEDYGAAGREETRAALEAAGMPYSGFTYTYIWEQDGHKIGFAGCRETIYKRNKSIIADETKALREQGCDVVIYSCHWGTEYDVHHNELQIEMAQKAAEAGVDIVLGGHPHVVQGFDRIGDTAVIWSMGNLMFGGTIDLTTFDATLVQLKLRFGADGAYKGVGVTYLPILTSGSSIYSLNDYRPVLAEGVDKERILKQIQDDSDIIIKDQMFVEKEN